MCYDSAQNKTPKPKKLWLGSLNSASGSLDQNSDLRLRVVNYKNINNDLVTGTDKTGTLFCIKVLNKKYSGSDYWILSRDMRYNGGLAFGSMFICFIFFSLFFAAVFSYVVSRFINDP